VVRPAVVCAINSAAHERRRRGGGRGGGQQQPTKRPHVASFWGRILDSVPRPAWSSPPEQSGPALTVQVTYEACGQPRTATCVEWSPLLLLKLRSNADHRGLRAGKNSAQFYGEVAHALGIRTGLSGSSAQALFGLCCRAHHELRFVHRVAGAGGQVCGGHALHRLLLQAGEVPEWQPNNMDVFVSGCRDMLAPLQYMDPDPQGQIQLPRDPRAPLSCALPNEHPDYCPEDTPARCVVDAWQAITHVHVVECMSSGRFAAAQGDHIAYCHCSHR
jgi:hypothetical protein